MYISKFILGIWAFFTGVFIGKILSDKKTVENLEQDVRHYQWYSNHYHNENTQLICEKHQLKKDLYNLRKDSNKE